MSVEDKLKAITDEFENFAKKEKSKLEACAQSTQNDFNEKTGELDLEFKKLVREYAHNFNKEVDDLKEKAKTSLDSIKTNFVAIAVGIFALLLTAFSVMIYSSVKDVNSLQKDIMSARTTADAEKEKLTQGIEALAKQLETLKNTNQAAVNQLSATQASYQNRIQELEALNKELRRLQSNDLTLRSSGTAQKRAAP